ncbi:MAG: hypothetical protein K6T27_05150 [Thermoleophilum sp.]|nr:hypothetical protein [Thermoleophilum sp.]
MMVAPSARVWRWLLAPLLGLALLLSFGPRLAIAASDEEIVARLRQMIAILDRAEAAVRVNDVPAAQAAFQEYARSWAAIEDDIRPRARQMYLTLEENERALQAALWAQPFDSDRAMDAIDALRNVTRDLSVQFPSTRAEATASDLQSSARALLNELEQAQTALAAQRATRARQRVLLAGPRRARRTDELAERLPPTRQAEGKGIRELARPARSAGRAPFQPEEDR